MTIALQTIHADTCIIGAGAAGLFLAEALSRDMQKRVLIIEAGPRRWVDRRDVTKIECLRRPHRGIEDSRVIAFGGATNTWGGGLIRLAPRNLELIPNALGTEWPISWGELKHYYKKTEKALGIFSFEANEADTMYPLQDYKFRSRSIAILPFSRRNFARTIGTKLLGHSNCEFRFLTHSIFDIIIDDDRVNALGFISEDGARFRVEARDYVLAAGMVDSNLLASKLLSCTNDAQWDYALGRFCHDHLTIPLFRVVPRSRRRFSKRFAYKFQSGLMIANRFEIEPEAASRKSCAGAFLRFTFDISGSALLRSLKSGLAAMQRRESLVKCEACWEDLLRSSGDAFNLALLRFCNNCLFIPNDVPVTAVLVMEQIPNRQWRLESNGGRHASGRLTWDIGDEDIENARRYTLATRELIQQLKRESEFTSTELFPDPSREAEAFSQFIRASAYDSNHLGGGLRMGIGPASAVVSPQLQFHGLKNVFAVSTAVFPRGGSANPTHTILALATRLADRLQAT